MAVALLFFAGPKLAGQQRKPMEYQVKAAYLQNFGRFVEWPPAIRGSTEASFRICVLGDDPFGASLENVFAGEVIGERSVEAHRIARLKDSSSCHILFISASEADQVKQILSSLDRAGVLTVSDIPRFLQSGGMIQFVSRDNRIRFEINLAAVESAGLALSSELLKVALAVRTGSASGE
jgi:hypothetical protein